MGCGASNPCGARSSDNSASSDPENDNNDVLGTEKQQEKAWKKPKIIAEPIRIPTDEEIFATSASAWPRPSVSSVMLTPLDPNASEERGSSNASIDAESPSRLQYICHTDVSFEWLYHRLTEKLSLTDPQPQWMAEKLNRVREREQERCLVVRITMGWESDKGPKDVVLKIPLIWAVDKTNPSNPGGPTPHSGFKRECNVYEYIQKHENLVAAPTVFHIKRNPNDSGGAALILEDLATRTGSATTIKCDIRTAMSPSAVHSLVITLARLHGCSMKHQIWSTLIADLSARHYAKIEGRREKIRTLLLARAVGLEADSFSDFDTLFSADSLMTCATPVDGEPRVLVHSEPHASNVFVNVDGVTVAALIDWSYSHSGSFGEDLAKAIGWNLIGPARTHHCSGLLETYCSELRRVAGTEAEIVTMEQVREAYTRALPLATASLLFKLSEMTELPDTEQLMERAVSLLHECRVLAQLRK